MRSAPDEVDVPELGLLQWWADSPYDSQHWYVAEGQRVYRVHLDGGRPVAVSDMRGKMILRIVTAAVSVEEPMLL
jgi:hypothetical protein